MDVVSQHRGRLILSAVLAVLGALAGLVPYVVVYLVAEQLFLADHLDRGRLLTLALWAGIAVVAKIVLKALADAVSHAAAYRILAELRLALADRLTRMPLGRVRARSSGQLKKVLQDDVEQLELGLSHAIPDIAAAVAVPVASLVVMFVISWPLGLAALVTVLVAVALVIWGASRAGGLGEEESGVKANLNSAIISFLRGMKVIRGFLPQGAGFAASDQAIADAEQIENAKMSRGKWQAVCSTALIGSAVVVILPLGLWGVYAGWLAPATLVFFLLVGSGFAQPLLSLLISIAVLQYQVEAGMKNINEILVEPDLAEPSDPRIPQGHDLRVEGVGFAYPGGPDVLHDIHLEIGQGQSLALVGPSGGGKSTLLGLLARFHDVTEGSIRLGGVDLREIDPGVLMRQIAYVQQDDYIFADTVLENIRMARPEASDAEVMAAAERAQVAGFVEELEDGWQTVLPAGGGRLSGGQRQRISIARALLNRAQVVLLDEATAFLDPESEAAVGRALAELRRGATVVTVAHRLGTITDHDQIAFLQGGRVLARGTHTELVKRCPEYAELWQAYQQAHHWQLVDPEASDHEPVQPTSNRQEPGDPVASEPKPGEEQSSAGHSVIGGPVVKRGRSKVESAAGSDIRVRGLAQRGALGQWLGLLGDQRRQLWRRSIWWIVIDGFLVSAPLVVVLFALLEALGGRIGADAWWRFGLPLVGIFVARWLVGVHLASTWWPATNRAVADLRRSVLRCLRRIPLGRFDELNVGRTSTLLVSDLPLVDFINLPAKIIVGLIQPVLAAVVLFILDWRVALAALAGLPIFAVLLWWSDRAQHAILGEVSQARAAASGDLLELVQGTAVLRANPDAPQASRYRRAVERLRAASVAMALRTSPLSSLASVFLELGFALLVWMVCLRHLDGGLPQTEAVLLLVVSLSLYRPYQELMDLSSYRHLQSHIVDRIAEIWDIEPLSEGTVAKVPGSGVAMQQVDFAYGDRPVLQQASFEAPAGEVTALVGPSGVGKSTVANLVARFWDVDGGAVRVGGTDVRELTGATLEHLVTTVYQDVYLFSTTVRENLDLGGNHTEAELVEALRAAQAYDFVQRLPGGLEAELTEGGGNLSGGERQRLSIARALLKDSPVLLLDEAVASVDPQTEVRIQQALSSLVAGRTVLVIVHRLNTIRTANRIVVLADHGVEASGTHDELLQISPTYQRLWAAQEESMHRV